MNLYFIIGKQFIKRVNTVEPDLEEPAVKGHTSTDIVNMPASKSSDLVHKPDCQLDYTSDE